MLPLLVLILALRPSPFYFVCMLLFVARSRFFPLKCTSQRKIIPSQRACRTSTRSETESSSRECGSGRSSSSTVRYKGERLRGPKSLAPEHSHVVRNSFVDMCSDLAPTSDRHRLATSRSCSSLAAKCVGVLVNAFSVHGTSSYMCIVRYVCVNSIYSPWETALAFDTTGGLFFWFFFSCLPLSSVSVVFVAH